jgi:hypothetical protein
MSLKTATVIAMLLNQKAALRRLGGVNLD